MVVEWVSEVINWQSDHWSSDGAGFEPNSAYSIEEHLSELPTTLKGSGF